MGIVKLTYEIEESDYIKAQFLHMKPRLLFGILAILFSIAFILSSLYFIYLYFFTQSTSASVTLPIITLLIFIFYFICLGSSKDHTDSIKHSILTFPLL